MAKHLPWFILIGVAFTALAVRPFLNPLDQNLLAQEKGVESQPAANIPSQSSADTGKVIRTEQQWRAMLSPEAYRVLREKGTERPYTNEYDEHFQPGAYACAACGQILFESKAKFNSGCGWPAFYAAKAGDRVKLTEDGTLGMVRTEVTCARCNSHLGHIFDDAPQTPTGQRYCINSVSLKFIAADKLEDKLPPKPNSSSTDSESATDR